MTALLRLITPAALSAGLLLTLTACKEEPPPSVRSGPKLERRGDDQRYYELGAKEPFTGTQRTYAAGSRALIYECHYVNGLKEGWERRWFKDKPTQLYTDIFNVQGERAFYFEYWQNGQLRELTSQREGSAFERDSVSHGTYVKWFEDGRVKFRAHYDLDFRWHGKVLDYDDNGQLMWDAVFDHGVYVSGHHPPDYVPRKPKAKKEGAGSAAKAGAAGEAAAPPAAPAPAK